MSVRRDAINAVRGEINDLVQKHGGRSVSLFGSVARGDDHDQSDIDLLVEFEDGSSLFDLLHLTDELRDLLGFDVDVVSVGGLTQRDDHIRLEAIPL